MLFRSDTLWTRGWQTIGLPDAALDAHALETIDLPFGGALEEADIDRPVGALVRTQVEDAEEFEITLERVEDGGRAGIAVYADAKHFYRLTIDAHRFTFDRVVDDLVHRAESVHAFSMPLRLRIEATAARYRFLIDDVEVGAGSARLLSAETAESFVAVRFALVAEGDRHGNARFAVSSGTEAPA